MNIERTFHFHGFPLLLAVGRKLFQEFLQSQYSDENLRFWLAADDYQSRSPDERKETARKVYEDFISTISPCEVRIVFCFGRRLYINRAGPSSLFLR